MAQIIPTLNQHTLARMQSGEKRVVRRLQEFLEDDYLVWYDIPVGKNRRYPDFIVLHPSRGLLFLEVKDWKPDTLRKITQQPPAKAGGLVLWTESPDTGRKTRLIFSPEVIVNLRFKVMIQVFFNHLFRQFTRGNTKVASSPKMPSPIATLQLRKAFKQLRRTTTFNSAHDLTCGHIRRRRDKKMYMIPTHDSLEYFNFKSLACLTYQFSRLQTHITLKYLISIFRNKYKMVLNFIYRMTTIAIFHLLLPSSGPKMSITDKSDRLKAVVLTFKRDE